MKHTGTNHPRVHESELLGAALRYCAVADWFESHPCAWRKRMTMKEAMEAFNRVEVELRQAGTRLLRQPGHRALVMQAAGLEGVST
ncbi:MAG: hypothetical protein IT442_04740 [Phycisphaeraceae bacterium]|nr:hypothetical protein [Phycisphaeraceae bacterium]